MWRWGMPSNYGAAGEPLLGFTHGVHWIYNKDTYGWRGFKKSNIGDIIVFNNRDPQLGTGRSGFSSVVQLTPPWNRKTQDYGFPKDGEAFEPVGFKRRITQFTREGDHYEIGSFDIDSDFQGNAQLLPHRSYGKEDRIMMAIGAANNNNSTNGAQGDMYELDSDATGANAVSVWRYVNPFVPPEEFWDQNNGPKPVDIKLDPFEEVDFCDARNFGFKCNSIFRALKYAPDFEGIRRFY